MNSAKVFWVCVGLSILGMITVALAQDGQNREEPSWAPKPVQPSKWIPPNKPHTKLSDLKAKYKGKADWREVIVSDDHLHAEYLSMGSGGKESRRFHPDTREW